MLILSAPDGRQPGFEWVRSSRSSPNSTPNAEATKAIAGIFEQWQKKLEEDNASDEEDLVDGISFIHLRDAQFFVPGQNPVPAKPTYWRAKLSEISGFSLGQLGADQPD